MSDPPPEPPASRSRIRRIWSWIWPALAIPPLMLLVGRVRAPDLPAQAPDFTLQTIDGQTLRLADYRGRTVLLNFWATWCGPCRLEMPSLASFARDTEVAVVGLAADTPEALRAFVEREGTPYPNAVAPESLRRAYDVDTFPTTVVVGPDGRVVRAHTGLALGPMFWLLTR